MWNLARRHPDDEALIAHLDGELPGKADSRVAAHLRSCWQCRTRQAQIEEEIRALAQAGQARTFPGAAQVAASRERLLARLEVMASQLAQARVRPAPRLRLLRPAWGVALAGVLMVAAASFVWLRPVAPQPVDAPQVLGETRGFETALAGARLPVHQVFRVEMRETGLKDRRDVSRLEVWSDAGNRRYASQWLDQRGVVRCALWRPGSGHEYTYFREAVQASAAGPDATVYLTDNTEAGLERFQQAFLRWLDGTRWRLVSLSAELAHFSGEDGAALEVRRAAGALVVTASRNGAQAVLEVEEASHRPRALSLRYERGGRVLAVRLLAERMETVEPAKVPPAAFRPPVPPAEEIRPAQPAIVREAPPRPAPPSPESLDAAEVQVLYALHQRQSCLGDPVDLVRHPSGRLEIRGQVATAERKRQLQGALGAIPFVSVQLQSADEAVRTATVHRVAQPVEVRVEKSAVAGYLEQYLRKQSPTEVPARASDLSDQAVLMAQAALTQAWALRRLAEWAEPEKADRLAPESRRLLAAMVHDHLNALRSELARQDALLRPLLAAAGPASPAGAPAAPPRDWQTAALELFQGVERVERLTIGLFARAAVSPQHTEQDIQGLLAALAQTQHQFQGLDARLTEAL